MLPALEYLWLVEGDLKTATPLLIGDGGVRRAPPPGGPEDADKVELATAAKTRHGTHMVAAIPGTSLKGAMRAAAGAGITDRAFGKMEKKKPDGDPPTRVGGLITFSDAPATDSAVAGEGESWRPETRTCQRASTAIDDRLGVADEHKLYYFEYVPAGVTFKITLTGKSYDADGQRLTDLLAALRPGLAALGSGRAVLGAAIQNGWGAFSWVSSPRVRKMPASGIAGWMNLRAENGERKGIFDAVAQADPEPVGLPAPERKSGRVSIAVELEMNGPLLVNDASRTGTAEQNKPSHAASRHGSKTFVPEKSIRGVLRHQAERILRTMGAQVAEDPKIQGKDDLPKLAGHPAHALFGAAGWRAPFEVSEFTADAEAPIQRQEFVAIDRFTGGGIERRKYNAEGARGVTLKGRLRLDVARLALARGGVECLGLLALTLRDLAEGDVSLGWGAGRGYGAVKKLSVSLDEVPDWADCLTNGAMPSPRRITLW